MIRILLLCLVLLPAAARAEFTLSDMVGTWSGSGTYTEGVSQARMRCRIVVAGGDARVRLSGRCGSSLGAEDVAVEAVRQPDGRIALISPDGPTREPFSVREVSGVPQGDRLVLHGSAGVESVTVEFRRNANGTLSFVTQRKWRTGRSQSQVTTGEQHHGACEVDRHVEQYLGHLDYGVAYTE